MKVDYIDVDERFLIAHDVSNDNYKKTMHGFIIEEEFKRIKY